MQQERFGRRETVRKREIKYDYLRAAAIFAIIAVHSIPAEVLNERQWWFAAAVIPVLLSFVGIYFMLSGMFLLASGTEDIPGFYRNRVRNIVIPFAIYSVIYYGYNIYRSKSSLQWWEHVPHFLQQFLNGTIPLADHMWFMYVIIALYICTPFLARMMKALSDRELKWFVVVMVVIQGLITYLTAFYIDLGKSLEYMVFKGWLIYFVLGYALKRLCRREQFKWFALLGAAGFCVTLIQKRFTPNFTPGIHDLAWTMIAMTAAIFLFFEYYGDWKNKTLGRIASWLSRHSYSAYLIHYLILDQFVVGFIGKTAIRHFYIPKTVSIAVITAVLSFAAAFVLDGTIIKWTQRLMEGKRKIKILR